MTHVRFDFRRLEESPASGFDLGYMVMEVEAEHSSSAEMNQSMMIYLAIADLLVGLCSLAEGRRKRFEFVGADSSYAILFNVDGKQWTIAASRRPLGQLLPCAILQAVLEAVRRFTARPENQLLPSDSAYEDFFGAVRTFEVRVSARCGSAAQGPRRKIRST